MFKPMNMLFSEYEREKKTIASAPTFIGTPLLKHSRFGCHGIHHNATLITWARIAEKNQSCCSRLRS